MISDPENQSHKLKFLFRYGVASIARNNLVASAQNIQGAQVDCTISSLCWSLISIKI